MKSFLLIDDDPIFTFLAEKTIDLLGIQANILKASNGKEAFDLIVSLVKENVDKTFIDYILLDLNMPILDGFGFIEALLREDTTQHILQHTKIIIVTSSINPKDIERAKNLGIEHYLTKPISPVTLKRAMAIE
jgi:CheY-like chemotaxis protein